MVTKVEGWLTADGTFFDDIKDAALYEARQHLFNRLKSHGVNVEAFLDLLRVELGAIDDYISNLKNVTQGKAKASDVGPMFESNQELKQDQEPDW